MGERYSLQSVKCWKALERNTTQLRLLMNSHINTGLKFGEAINKHHAQTLITRERWWLVPRRGGRGDKKSSLQYVHCVTWYLQFVCFFTTHTDTQTQKVCQLILLQPKMWLASGWFLDKGGTENEQA
uniref:Uncharacterized protein n=1 Tax=Micrurus spixii TaxID=129469 RepID=A0A2D4LTJ7_9SAUR